MDRHAIEVAAGERFEFGENWRHFLEQLDESRIAAAETSLKNSLEVADLQGRRFLDAGSGSGLFSLAARRLGADVYSFDFDPASVGCTQELKNRFFPDDGRWSVQRGDVLDTVYLRSLGTFDVVYSWGVLHHTGAMWDALANVIELVRPGGLLFVALYNDQGEVSNRWRAVKKLYNGSSKPVRTLLLGGVASFWLVRAVAKRALRGVNPLPTNRIKEYQQRSRGMSPWHDLVDWVGGYPFEVARPEDVLDFCRTRGLTLIKLKTVGGALGCNEYVFASDSTLPPHP